MVIGMLGVRETARLKNFHLSGNLRMLYLTR